MKLKARLPNENVMSVKSVVIEAADCDYNDDGGITLRVRLNHEGYRLLARRADYDAISDGEAIRRAIKDYCLSEIVY